LAVGVIGAAFRKIASLVESIIMPPIKLLTCGFSAKFAQPG
jgi:large-conductance mechanosensitive channel